MFVCMFGFFLRLMSMHMPGNPSVVHAHVHVFNKLRIHVDMERIDRKTHSKEYKAEEGELRQLNTRTISTPNSKNHTFRSYFLIFTASNLHSNPSVEPAIYLDIEILKKLILPEISTNSNQMNHYISPKIDRINTGWFHITVIPQRSHLLRKPGYSFFRAKQYPCSRKEYQWLLTWTLVRYSADILGDLFSISLLFYKLYFQWNISHLADIYKHHQSCEECTTKWPANSRSSRNTSV